MQTMAKNYMDMVRFARKLPHKVAVAMAGSPSCRLVLDPEIFKQINSLRWSDYEMDESDGPYSPLPFNLFESMRVRLWANVKAIKQHVHAMNLNYNRVTNERRISLGKTRPPPLPLALFQAAATFLNSIGRFGFARGQPTCSTEPLRRAW